MNEWEAIRDDDREHERRDDELDRLYPDRLYVGGLVRDPLDYAPASEVGLAPLDENFAGRSGVGGRETTPAASSDDDQPAVASPGAPSSCHSPRAGTAANPSKEAA